MRTILILIPILFNSHLNAQDISEWQGHYSGELEISNYNGDTNSFHMELKIEAKDDSTFSWVIIYGKENDSLRSERNYLLKKTKRKNLFIIDEQNSILLNISLINNSFYSVFEVQGNLIMTEYRLIDKQIVFMLTSSQGKTETGNKTLNDEEIPLVYSYKTTTVQKAVLMKQ